MVALFQIMDTFVIKEVSCIKNASGALSAE